MTMILFCIMPDEQNIQIQPDAKMLESLLMRISNEDISALEQLYQQTYHAIYGFILSIMKNQHDAEDILQDTYIKIKTGAHLYKPKGKPLAWIFVIARNLSYMKLRHEKLYASTAIQELENSLDFSAVENNEDRLLLDAAFSILSDEERQIVILHANTGMKHREIAVLLKLPLSTVLSKYNRALKKLRIYMEGKVY